ncbi:dienelactone hydrolase [Hymenopellis radicata]|nr:dienelactone hydrolase [Hymenopellis radicata]
MSATILWVVVDAIFIGFLCHSDFFPRHLFFPFFIMSMCADCFSGVVHEGTPTGKLEVIGGVECYTATPEGDYAEDKVLLYLSDAVGLALTVMMDYFNGDAIPVDYLTQEGGFDALAWIGRHGREATRPRLTNKGLWATGYCFGGRYVFDLAFDGVVKVGTTAHPSMLTFPDDFEKYVSTASAPLQINSCEFDEYFPPAIQAKGDEIFANAKFAPGYERLYYEGCTHGFAVRGDISDPKIKAAKEGAFNASVQWLKKYL